MISTDAFEIIVVRDGEDVTVDINIEDVDEPDFAAFILATEFMMRTVAQCLGAGYMRALHLLVEGAMSWRETKGED